MTPRFKIGDQVWLARFESARDGVSCPDCGGTGRLRVTFHDDTTVSIECRNCSVGYDPPTGKVVCYERHPAPEPITVTGLEMNALGATYRLGGGINHWRSAGEEDVFSSREEAMVRAEAMAKEATEAERAQIFRKERDTRTWAWNASYHRGVIKRAQRDIEYHTAKLNVAALKAKDDKLAKKAQP